MFRYFTAGESHGKALVAIIEGVPAGLPVSTDDINEELARRQQGYGRGGRMKIEKDSVEFLSGIRGGYTLGSPITLYIENKDWVNWENYMTSEVNADLETRRVLNPRPGHVDLAGAIKYGHEDIRNVLERSSARETAIRVAVGAIAKKILKTLEIDIFSHVIGIGSVRSTAKLSFADITARAPKSPVFCADDAATQQIIAEIDKAKAQGNTLGGLVEIVALNLPMGLGSYTQWDRKLDGIIAQALMSVQAIKGVEFGLGFACASTCGSNVHDEIYYAEEQGFYHNSNNAGGIEGGVTNGEPLIVRAAMKPIPTLMQPLKSVNFITKEQIEASTERSDVCAVPAASVVGEAVVGIALVNAILEKFGGDTMVDLSKSLQAYRSYLEKF